MFAKFLRKHFGILPKCSLGRGGLLQPRYSRDVGRYSRDSGRAPVPQMTHTLQLGCFFSYHQRGPVEQDEPAKYLQKTIFKMLILLVAPKKC